MNLPEIRNKIDNLDIQIIDLLNQRMEYSLIAMRYKNTVCDPEREEVILRNVTSRKLEFLDNHFIKKLYGLIIKKSKQLQAGTLQTVEVEKKNHNHSKHMEASQ